MEQYNNTVPEQPGAYGGNLSGKEFSFLEFVKRPHVIIRALSLLFAIVVMGCMLDGSRVEDDGEWKCVFDHDVNACNFGSVISIVAFIGCLVFLVLDARFDSISNIQTRKRIVIADLIFAFSWAFMWFVCFVYLTTSWHKTIKHNYILQDLIEQGSPKAAISFSFFALLSWAGLGYFALKRYRQGVTTGFILDSGVSTPNPYEGYTGSPTSDPYQQPPSHDIANRQDKSEYDPPTY